MHTSSDGYSLVYIRIKEVGYESKKIITVVLASLLVASVATPVLAKSPKMKMTYRHSGVGYGTGPGEDLDRYAQVF